MLTMADMGHDMAGAGGMDHASAARAGMARCRHGPRRHAPRRMAMPGMEAAMNHAGMQHGAAAPDMAAMMHAATMPGTTLPLPPRHHPASETATRWWTCQQRHQPRLDDPGIGLRDNGRKVLRYADLTACSTRMGVIPRARSNCT
jgi:hypothetical protein